MLLTKVCTKCKVEKSIKEFSINRASPDKHAWNCKKCLKDYKDNRPKEILEAYKEVSKKHKKLYDSLDSTRHRNKTHSQNQKYRKFGITKSEFEQLLAKQNNCCAICGNTEINGKLLSIDHNHVTGKVRGLLCSGCNVGLGMFKENMHFLSKAVKYLTLNS